MVNAWPIVTGELARLAIQLHGLIRVAELPERQGEIAAMRHAGVVPRERGPELRALAVVVCGQRSLEVPSRGGEFPPVEHRDAGHEQRFHQDAGIGQAVGEPHTLAGQVHALSDVAAHQTPLPRAQHGSEQLRRLSGPFAQLAGTFQDGSDLGCGVPANGDVTGRQGAQELQLLGRRVRATLRARRRVSGPSSGGRWPRPPPTVLATAAPPSASTRHPSRPGPPH